MAVTARKLKRSAGQAASRNGHRGELRQLVIISGMSGSGKKTVINTFEDLGFYCVDNLPVDLIPRFAELARHSVD
ncbi:MAG TPA: RNase adapter RapZ, partial [Terriglobales bacterium]